LDTPFIRLGKYFDANEKIPVAIKKSVARRQ